MMIDAVILSCLYAISSSPVEKNFHEEVAPVLVRSCIECHNGSNAKGGLSLETLASALKGGEEGPAIVAGKAKESLLYQKIVPAKEGLKPQMPRKKAALTPEEVKKIQEWIDKGASWPKEVVLKEKSKADGNFWSLRPVRKEVPPVVKEAPVGWGKNPVDAFILAKLQEKGLRPSPPADRRTLLRRMSLDLTGLPPVLEDVQAFVEDPSADASERWLEKLLSSPSYGERWARHWLDVARFSESDGFEEDMQRPQAYTFRDYVIASLNADKPYNQFVLEQIAGDAQEQVTGETIAATGFLVAGPWDAVQRVTPSKFGRLQSREEQLEEIVGGVGMAFLGLTVQCARCHDHKFDPIPQRDYYQIKAVFEGVDHSQKAKVHGVRRLLSPAQEQEWQKQTEPIRRQISAMESKDAGLQKQMKDSSADANRVDQLKRERDALREQLEKQRQHLEKQYPVEVGFVGIREQPQPTVMFTRGDIRQPGEKVTANVLSVARIPQISFSQKEDQPEGERRLQFAKWLAHPDNPLTARVMVNRIWQYHFGVGLVDTPSDFGFNGGRPSHPELLDWLAGEFRRSGYSIKHMHRLIMGSATYQQACIPQVSTMPDYQKAYRVDADNRLLWRFPSLRLEGEVVRDAMLLLAGNLNGEMGGPSFKPYTVTQLNTYFYHLFDRDDPIYNRKSIYRMQVITGRSPLLDALDCPSPSVTIPKRTPTTTALQALALMNDSFVVRQAMKLAQKLEDQQPDVQLQVQRLYEMAYSRRPNESESARAVEVARQHGLATVCWVVFNSSEFLYNH